MGSSRRPLHFIVEVHGADHRNMPTHHILSHHASQSSAFGAVTEVLRQWSAAQGAISIGSRVQITDTRDGGVIWYMVYLGYEPQTLTGR